MPGARPQPCVQKYKTRKHRHHGHTGSPGIPYAMVLMDSFVLSPVTGYRMHTSFERQGSAEKSRVFSMRGD
jgi:hypothetical protein